MDASSPFLQAANQAQFRVCSRKFWNDTGIWLEAGVDYEYEVPKSEKWYDFWISTTANGYSRANIQQWEKDRRVPNQDWFRLIGAIDQNIAYTVVLGCGPGRFTAPASGQLSCFANDLPSMYWKNWGSIQGTIKRL